MMKSAAKPILLAAALGIAATAQAQTPGVDMKGTVGYVIDQRGYVAKSGAGLCWRTGYWTPAMAIAECDPDLVKKEEPKAAPAAAPAAQEQKPAAPAPKPAAQKVTMAADALFDFDKAVLRPEGRAKLDKLVDDMKGIKLEVVIAVGHADRIGSDKYNQKLSERRAAAVKDYLVSKGIEANRIYAEGKGEKQPVTGDKCKNMGKEHRSNKKLVECLQPDRRVEIEVIGTQEAK
ncbi:MAG: OmpA family protein [Rhodocyclaceae bacterium]|nr:OmpA family protein [Rhodocyclaceae bacterium]